MPRASCCQAATGPLRAAQGVFCHPRLIHCGSMADGNSPTRPEDLIEGSGRAGQPRNFGAALDPHLASENVWKTADRLGTVQMAWRKHMTPDELAAVDTVIRMLMTLGGRIKRGEVQ
jgi:hypothetical protein